MQTKDNYRKAFTLVEVLFVAATFFILITILTPFVNMMRGRANAINCANNLRKISIGLHTYALEHNGTFPAALAELYPNYVEDAAAFDCPAAKARGTPEKPDYKYTPGLTESSGLKEIIVEDIEGNHKKAGRNILRVNGAIDRVR